MALLTLAPRLKSHLVLLYSHLHSPALCELRATARVTVGRWAALVGSLHGTKQNRAPVPSLRSLTRGLVPVAQSLVPYGLLFQHLQVLSYLSGALGDARGKAEVSEVFSSGLGDPRAARTARAMVQSVSSAKLEGYHLQSPDAFITPVGKVNLP